MFWHVPTKGGGSDCQTGQPDSAPDKGNPAIFKPTCVISERRHHVSWESFWGWLEDKSAVLEMAGPPTLRRKSLKILPKKKRKKNLKVCISSEKWKQPLREKPQKPQSFKHWYIAHIISAGYRQEMCVRNIEVEWMTWGVVGSRS